MTNRFLTNPNGFSFSPVMLHTFGTIGYLPPGIHECTLESLEAIVCFTSYRRRMWKKLGNFLLWSSHSNEFSCAYLAGEFVSASRLPREIDLILETATEYGPESFEAISRFFVIGLEKIKKTHGIHLHFWMENAPPNVGNAKTFNQSQFRAQRQRLDSSRGIVRLNLKDPRIVSGLQTYANDDQDAWTCKF